MAPPARARARSRDARLGTRAPTIMTERVSIRIATYNIHKCRGMDRRVLPDRIASVITETKADIVALQEVVRASGRDQLEAIAKLADFPYCCFGENRKHEGVPYGNAILSRSPIERWKNYDITMPQR